MLILLKGHFIKNPRHIDKMICVKGLPEDWFFRKRGEDLELLKPWEPAISDNIPKHIRHLCDPVEIAIYYPPIEKGRDGILDLRTILGVALDYMTEPGREMWDKVVRYIDDSLPRSQRMPEPVLIAKDHSSPFETWAPKVSMTGGVVLEQSDIPVVNLTPEPILPPVAPVRQSPPVQPVVATPATTAALFKCDHCEYKSEKRQAVRMHSMKRHRKVLV